MKHMTCAQRSYKLPARPASSLFIISKKNGKHNEISNNFTCLNSKRINPV